MPQDMRKGALILTVVFLAAFAVNMAGTIFLCHAMVHPKRRDFDRKMEAAAEEIAQRANAIYQTVQIASFDGAILSASFFQAPTGNRDVVILLHSSADNRAGMLGFVPMLLRHQYNVLVPDSRAHGRSGGEIATFGPKESEDLKRWVDWLAGQMHPRCVYGLGESMGAGNLLQTLPREPRFCAAVADSPFSSYREMVYDRVGQEFGGGAWLGRTLFRPLIDEAFLEAKLRYHFNFEKASPADAVAMTRVPVLLIHGTKDFLVPLRHCQAILNNRSGVMELWEVPGADHVGAFGREPQEYERRVTDWFGRFPGRPAQVSEMDRKPAVLTF